MSDIEIYILTTNLSLLRHRPVTKHSPLLLTQSFILPFF